jgi:hypothetical protein
MRISAGMTMKYLNALLAKSRNPEYVRPGLPAKPAKLPLSGGVLTRPHINARGELIVPFESDRRFHWWAGGQTIRATLLELGASGDVLARYVDDSTLQAPHDEKVQ